MGPMVPENILCWQKEKREGRKRKKEKERKKRRKRKEKKKKRKDRKRKKRVTASISSHFVQGQILGVGGAPKIISERTLIA